ncbi:MAG: hypothetical protein ABI629_10945 [bacterium]
MRIARQMALALTGALLGLVAGTAAAGWLLVPAGSGLAGPAIALGWGLAASAASCVAALIAARQLGPRGLRRASTVATVVAVATLVLLAVAYYRSQAVYTDDSSAYAGLPEFTVSVQQTVITDPYLATRAEIDTRRRESAQTLPDGRVCSANLRAASQATIGALLGEVAAVDLGVCRRSAAASDERVVWQWRLDSAASAGEVDVSPACRRDLPRLARAIAAVKNVGVKEQSVVACK